MLCNNTEKWLYKLDKDYVWQSPYMQEKDWAFKDHTGAIQLKLMRDGQIVVMKGYCWDGCTPKFCIMDILFGTPEGAVAVKTGLPKTWDASLVHDALCQFLHADLPMSQRQVDHCMLMLLQEREFILSYTYYYAVRLFGWLSKPATNKLRQNQGGQRIELTAEQLATEKT